MKDFDYDDFFRAFSELRVEEDDEPEFEEEDAVYATPEEMKAEALKRMRFLHISENPIREFETEGKLNKSERLSQKMRGILYWLNDEEKAAVEAFEREHKCLVYHVILTHTEFGDWHTFLYIQKNKTEWEQDWDDLRVLDDENETCVFAYTYTGDCNSEFGSVVIEPIHGGVDRTA